MADLSRAVVKSVTETRKTIENSFVASLDMMLSNTRITKVLIRLHGCTGWSTSLLFAIPGRQIFLCRDPYEYLSL